jgi:hypothetical protein
VLYCLPQLHAALCVEAARRQLDQRRNRSTRGSALAIKLEEPQPQMNARDLPA